MLRRLVRTKTIRVLLVQLFLFFSGNSFATNYYVSKTGDDSNSGTSIEDAWATINKVNSSLFLPGDSLFFQGGQAFSGNIYLDGSDANDPDNIFVISTYGTGRATINAGSSYGFRAHNTQGLSISNLILNGNNVFTTTSTGILIDADVPGDVKFKNISISNIEVKNFASEGISIYSTIHLTGFQNVTLNNLSVHDVIKNGIVIKGYIAQSLVGWAHKNVSISNCEVYNVPGSVDGPALEGNGIVIADVDSGVIQNCVAHDNGQNNIQCGGPGGIWTLESNKITIQFCESYRNHSGKSGGCDGLGFDLDGGVTNSIMQYNYSHDNDGAGYLLGQYENARPWSNNTVRYNISENDAVTNEGGIGVFKGPGTTMTDAYIYNNIVYVSPQPANSAECAAYLQDWKTGINNVNFYNNVFITTGTVPFVRVPVGYTAFFAGNIYWNPGGSFSINYQGIHYTSLASWRAATGNEKVGIIDAGFNSDPLLTNIGAGGTIGYGNSLMGLNAYKTQNISSPVCDAALDLNSLYSINVGNIDFWRNPLPGGISNDIGAGQFSSVLPIKLLDFYGGCTESANNLFWNTAEEINMKSIELMYCNDGIHFSKLADFRPKGSNSGYSYINNSALAGDNFYQLKMTDLDGTITYSRIVKIQCEKVSGKINVWPNPFNQSIRISIESKTMGTASISLYDALGKLQLQRNLKLQPGNNQFTHEGLGGLPAGSYYLRIVNQDKVEYFKLLKEGN